MGQIDVFFAKAKRTNRSYYIILWQSKGTIATFFLLSDIAWVLPSMVKETPLSWHHLFREENAIRSEPWRVFPPCIYRNNFGKRNRRVYNREDQIAQRLKFSSLRNLVYWDTMYKVFFLFLGMPFGSHWYMLCIPWSIAFFIMLFPYFLITEREGERERETSIIVKARRQLQERKKEIMHRKHSSIWN